MLLWSFVSSHILFVPHEVVCSVSLLNRYTPLVFFDQSQMPSAGPTSGNATSGTTRICDAEAPEGKSVISASTVR